MNPGSFESFYVWFDQKLRNLAAYKSYVLAIILGMGIFASSILVALKLQKNSIRDPQEPLKETVVSVQVAVDISGAVEKPGLYWFPVGSRVEDAIKSVGGFSSEANRSWVEKNLNLAAKLMDGTKIYVPRIGESQTSIAQKYEENPMAKKGKTNINSASIEELEALPGIGLTTARKIISSRPYLVIEDLINRKIIYKSTFEKIKDLLVVY